MDIPAILATVNKNLIMEITSEIVALDSQNPPGKCDHIVKYLAKKCTELGFEVKVYPMDEERHNIVASIGTGSRDIVLSGHLDTVPIGDEKQWNYPPLKVTIEGDKMFGRGTADMKGGVVSLIAAMDAILRSGVTLTHRVVFAGTADEEVGMYGAFHLQKQGIMDKADGLIITEATSLQVGIAEKGPHWIRFHVKGKAAHGSMPSEGINAIEGACLVINALETIIPETTHTLLGKSTLNVGLIKGGTKINIVPENCSFDCDFRLVPGVDREAFNGRVKALLENLSKKHPYKFSFEVIHTIPAICTGEEEALVRSMLKWTEEITGNPQKPIGLSYGTDAAALIPPKEIPFIIFGGGDSSVIHKTDEYVPLSELVLAAKVIAATILELYSD